MLRESNNNKKPQAQREGVPGPCDVLFGRGTPYRDYVGNLALHELTDQYMPLYKSFTAKSTGAVQRKQQYGVSSKQEIVDRIIDMVHAKGGRFLRKDSESGQWVQVSTQDARTKVCHILRGHARKATRKTTTTKKDCASRNKGRGKVSCKKDSAVALRKDQVVSSRKGLETPLEATVTLPFLPATHHHLQTIMTVPPTLYHSGPILPDPMAANLLPMPTSFPMGGMRFVPASTPTPACWPHVFSLHY